jgi:hypothetical protein
MARFAWRRAERFRPKQPFFSEKARILRHAAACGAASKRENPVKSAFLHCDSLALMRLKSPPTVEKPSK